MKVECVSEKTKNKLDLYQAPATTCATTLNGKYSGNSIVYFNRDLAFTSAKCCITLWGMSWFTYLKI